MADVEKISQIVFEAVAEINQQLAEEQRLKESRDTVLFDPSGGLDSLSLVNFIVIIEDKIKEKFGIEITLADEEAMSREKSPFVTVGSLIDYICLLLNKKLPVKGEK